MSQNGIQPAMMEAGGRVAPTAEQKNYMYIVYAMYALAPFVGLTSIVGVILAYLKRDEMRATVYGDHLCFLIKTFWVTLVGTLLGVVLSIVGIGLVILALVGVWYIFRVVVGLVRFFDQQPVTPDGWWM